MLRKVKIDRKMKPLLIKQSVLRDLQDGVEPRKICKTYGVSASYVSRLRTKLGLGKPKEFQYSFLRKLTQK